jgi:hypothetical protein
MDNTNQQVDIGRKRRVSLPGVADGHRVQPKFPWAASQP